MGQIQEKKPKAQTVQPEPEKQPAEAVIAKEREADRLERVPKLDESSDKICHDIDLICGIGVIATAA